MEQLNYNRKGKHLSSKERYKIEILRKEKNTAKEIAEKLGRGIRTIERELSRGKVKLRRTKKDWCGEIVGYEEYYEYSSEVGEQAYRLASTAKGAGLKIGKDYKLAEYIEKCIGEERLSPYATSERIKANREIKTKIHWKTIYNYLDKDLFMKISNKDLWVKKDGKKRKYQRIRQAYNNSKGRSIEERPKAVEERKEIGHMEMDTVVGKQGSKAALLVFTDRATRYEIIMKLKEKTQAEVIKALDKLERRWTR